MLKKNEDSARAQATACGLSFNFFLQIPLVDLKSALNLYEIHNLTSKYIMFVAAYDVGGSEVTILGKQFR